jgi:hypothetical protein
VDIYICMSEDRAEDWDWDLGFGWGLTNSCSVVPTYSVDKKILLSAVRIFSYPPISTPFPPVSPLAGTHTPSTSHKTPPDSATPSPAHPQYQTSAQSDPTPP